MLAVVCLIFGVLLAVPGAADTKRLETKDVRKGHLEFTVEKLECNDASTHCMKCFTVQKFGSIFSNTFTYSKDTHNFQFITSPGLQEWHSNFLQGDDREPFRACWNVKSSQAVGLSREWEGTMCMDNHFSEVPGDCTQPIVQVYIVSHLDDNEPRGQTTLFCI